MPSEFHWWGLDTQFTAAGDDAAVSAIDQINQSIIRECLTAPGEYVWDPGYGLGLGRHVGQALTADRFAAIKAGIAGVTAKQPEVRQQPAPVITFINDLAGLVAAQIAYTYAPTGQAVTLTIPASR